ncbi:abscisic acid receptor PYL11-like [Panicum virgatum]|uniref:Uncharacterized protein n=1 Tax=Panicum virgatum TaxID=38727 RepID=A0A8T0S3W6_PANVG|nr:abscisic acid receptor PYL11-like [Panicum virgatum]KAG2592659.1 hypothetical protein PVAP13_5NG570200 [Panicum virgatum]KAG2592660.1 hypothetical protein PVAP13_5NG570200 [Panicum virgatum]
MSDTTSRMSSQQHGCITSNGSAASTCPGHPEVPSEVARHHEHVVAAGQCCSVVVRTMEASVDAVWSLVRRFDDPQGYKGYIASCDIVEGDGATVGSVRELTLISGMPGRSSRERLEILDDEQRVISFRILGGEHRFFNYRSVTTVHEAMSPDGPVTMVVESYAMDVMAGNTAEETCYIADTFIGFNHLNLAHRA